MSTADRFQEENATEFSRNFTRSSRTNRDEDGCPDILVSAAGYTCQNCGETVDGLTLVPEFEYWGCDECMVEALKVIAVESKAALQIVHERRAPSVAALLDSASDLLLDEGVA